MTLKLTKEYKNFLFLSVVSVLDAILLALINENLLAFGVYLAINVLLIPLFERKLSLYDSLVFSIIFFLFYPWVIDVLIHYLDIKVIFETEFLILLPILGTCLKIRKPKNDIFLMFCVGYIPFNAIVTILSRKVDLENYFRFSFNIMIFVCFYYIFTNIIVNQRIINLFKYIFVVCCTVTLAQTFVGFSVDTRNALFSVFGFGGYTIFLMTFVSYNAAKFVYKLESFKKFALAIVVAEVVFICTESKAASVMVFISIGAISIVQKGVSIRKMFIVILGIAAIPVAYSLLLKFNPKFSYLNNIHTIMRYYLGNNSWKYEYGRFPAIKNVFLERDWFTRIIGVGFGSSTPLYAVFYNELGRDPNFPYYINEYGYYYGYQHTSFSSLVLDGGLILAISIIIMMLVKIFKTVVNMQKNKTALVYPVQLGVFMYLLYYFTYANILKDFRAMAITAIVFAMREICEAKTDRIEGNYDLRA